MEWRAILAGREIPVLMGIVNVTPDSFSDGGLFLSPAAAIDHGLRLAGEGAAILDVGGESTRPRAYGEAEEVPHEREIERVVPVIEALARRSAIPVSVDTRKGAVVRAALAAGASIVNDVTALRYDPAVGEAAAGADAAVVLMHMRGTDPRTMQDNVAYADPIGDVAGRLAEAAERAEAAGIGQGRIALDPGLGFGKSAAHSLLLVARLRALAGSGFPVVVGASRKGFTARFSGVSADAPFRDRLAGSLACAAASAAGGAAVLRVHDVAATSRFLAALRSGTPGPEAAAAAGADPDAYARMEAALRDAGAAEARIGQ